MTGPMEIEKAKSFYNGMKITVKCIFSEVILSFISLACA